MFPNGLHIKEVDIAIYESLEKTYMRKLRL